MKIIRGLDRMLKISLFEVTFKSQIFSIILNSLRIYIFNNWHEFYCKKNQMSRKYFTMINFQVLINGFKVISGTFAYN